ncbi:MAG: hypothetical protein ACI88A_004942 [Paraglaciecola sp.]|jgi:hypothetical protein
MSLDVLSAMRLAIGGVRATTLRVKGYGYKYAPALTINEA